MIKEGSIILTPGKFEMEMSYVPHFWDVVMNGGGEEVGDGVVRIKVTDEDRKEYPDLVKLNRDEIFLWESPDGFVFETKGE